MRYAPSNLHGLASLFCFFALALAVGVSPAGAAATTSAKQPNLDNLSIGQLEKIQVAPPPAAQPPTAPRNSITATPTVAPPPPPPTTRGNPIESMPPQPPPPSTHKRDIHPSYSMPPGRHITIGGFGGGPESSSTGGSAAGVSGGGGRQGTTGEASPGPRDLGPPRPRSARMAPIRRPVLPGQYQVEAAYIYNFLKYVDLPPSQSKTLCIGILGFNSDDAAFDSLNGKVVRGRTIVVRHLWWLPSAPAADVLFVSRDERGRLHQVLNKLNNTRVLTIGELDGFAHDGGMINFTIQDQRVRFEINPDAARRAQIRVSSQLLRLATIVR